MKIIIRNHIHTHFIVIEEAKEEVNTKKKRSFEIIEVYVRNACNAMKMLGSASVTDLAW